MNGTYDRFLHQLAPNYLGLLRTALAWTLLADADVTVQEIMDAYTGTYLIQTKIDNTREHDSLEDSSCISNRSETPAVHSSISWIIGL